MHKTLAVKLREPGDFEFLLRLAGRRSVTGFLLVMLKAGFGLVKLRFGVPVEAVLCSGGKGQVGGEALRALGGSDLLGAIAVLVNGIMVGEASEEGIMGAKEEGEASEASDLEAWSKIVFDPVNMASILLEARFIGVRHYDSGPQLLEGLSSLFSSLGSDYLYARIQCNDSAVKLLGTGGTLAAAFAEARGGQLYGADALRIVGSCKDTLKAYLYRVPSTALPSLPAPSCRGVEECTRMSVERVLGGLGVEAEIMVRREGDECIVEVRIARPRIALHRELVPMISELLEEAVRETLYMQSLKPLKITINIAGQGERPK